MASFAKENVVILVLPIESRVLAQHRQMFKKKDSCKNVEFVQSN
jgi:hypothetical protein